MALFGGGWQVKKPRKRLFEMSPPKGLRLFPNLGRSGVYQFVTWDSETHLIKPGMAAPRQVCVSAVENRDKGNPLLMDRPTGLAYLRAKLADPKVILIGHNVFYDLGVACAEDPGVFVPLVFKALDDFRIRDTIVRQMLIDIVTGQLKYRWDEETGEYKKTGYSLADLAMRLLQRVLPKEGTWRLRYGSLDGVPIEEWPADARSYAIDDSITTDDCFWTQALMSNDDPQKQAIGGEIPTEDRATREAWALWLMSAWGVRTDGELVSKLKIELQAEQDIAIGKLSASGIYKQDRKKTAWSKDMAKIYAAVEAGFQAIGEEPPRTATGRPQTDHETLERVPCAPCAGKGVTDAGPCQVCNADGRDPELPPDEDQLPVGKNPDLQVLAASSKGAKLLNTYVPLLEHGCNHPICARFNVLVESNRTSCSGPNLQNPPRKGGVRQCFIPRPGFVYCSADYDTIELRSLAQACLDILGHSEMAIALRAGEDLHLNLAADFMGISREECKRRYDAGDKEVSDMRQMMKPANFGFPGGMQSDSFVDYAAGMGVKVDRGLAKRIHENWKRVWPEMAEYFSYIKNLVGPQNEGTVISPRSGFVRGGLRFTQAANHFFQSLTATGAKDALWNVTRECYTDPKSPLWGCRPVIFMHDEIITEMPEDRAAEAAERKQEIMVSVMQKWIPDIPIKAGPVLFRRWYKGAKAVKVDGRLVPSKPVEIDGKEKWVADMPEAKAA